MRLKILITTCSISLLSACVGMGDTEKETLKSAAIESAIRQEKGVHLAYLQCYGLNQHDKKSCRRKASRLATPDRSNANTWEFILPFDYESERLGFKAFLNDAGKSCSGVNQGPKYNKETNAYDVICTDSNQYRMRFNSAKGKWLLAE